MSETNTHKITIIGAGVIGLTTALHLQADGHRIHIITRDLPDTTTSKAAGAIWWGHGTGDIQRWATASLKRFMAMADAGNQGVLWIDLREVFTAPVALPYFADMLPKFERIPSDALEAPYRDGFKMRVPLVESPVYLTKLLENFKANGGTIEQHELNAFDEIDADLIVNCSGVWARDLANDPGVYPKRGQVVVAQNTGITQGYMDDETFTYIFPRGDGVVLGGVAGVDDWNTEPDDTITREILERCAKIEPSISDQKTEIAKVLVGLRPYRDTVRIETEYIGDKTVIHHYGHGGVGYTLSWGTAEDVVRLVNALPTN